MSGRAEELIYRYFIDKFPEKTEMYVGVEIEMPVLNLDKRPVKPEFLRAMIELLVHNFDFRPTGFTLNGFPIEAVNPNGDVFSFETSFNTIEFSMARKQSVTEIADRFYQYLEAIKHLEQAYNHLICGMGSNPFAAYADSRPLNTLSMNAKSEFLKRFTTHHNGEVFHAFSAATQTHLGVNRASLPFLLNLLGKLAFADAILFANSLPFPCRRTGWKESLPVSLQHAMRQPTLCFRDTLWKLCEAPNTALFDREYGSTEDVVDHLMQLKLFVVTDDSQGYRPIRPVGFADYFADQDKPERDIHCFRSLEPVAVTKYGTIEIRQTCTQPLSRVFAPVAFYTGLAENEEKAAALVADFWRENSIRTANSLLRCQAARQKMIIPQEKISRFIMSLLAISREGLQKRGGGEEKYLAPLLEAENLLACPAQTQLRLLNQGLDELEIISAYSEVGKAADRMDGNGKKQGVKQMNYQHKKSIAEFDLELVNREIEAFCAENGLPPAKLFTLQLIVEELVTNIIKYGGKTGREASIEIELRDEPGKVVLIIADDTDAFNPLAMADPDITLPVEERKIGGLGIFLVRKRAQSLSYTYRNGKNIVEAVL